MKLNARKKKQIQYREKRNNINFIATIHLIKYKSEPRMNQLMTLNNEKKNYHALSLFIITNVNYELKKFFFCFIRKRFKI